MSCQIGEAGKSLATYESSTNPVDDSVGQTSPTLTTIANIKPMNFRQVFQEKQQLISVRPVSSTFQQTGDICNVANGDLCRRRRKEVSVRGRGSCKNRYLGRG